MQVYENIIKELKERNKTIATMESCTGGAVASEITNHPGASEVLKFSAVTYSNEYKIKMGVNPDIIDQYSVYSIETAIEMAKNIAEFAGSDFGVGVTGKINTPDPANNYGADDEIFVAIYDRENDVYYRFEIDALKNVSREDNKKNVVNHIGISLFNMFNPKEDWNHEHEFGEYMQVGDKLIRNCNICGHLEVKKENSLKRYELKDIGNNN